LQELQQAVHLQDLKASEEELGDVLFSVVNYARFLNIDPDSALERTNSKFMHRFQSLEKIVHSRGRDIKLMTLAEMDEVWNEIKQKNKEDNP
jgi:XTP/dITP diphosphohydrolase